MRRLLTTRRHVPLDRADDYLAAWTSARREVETLGARAWVFRRAGHDDQFIEFIEWSGESAPHESAEVETARSALDAFAPGTTYEWEGVQ
jgi:hypothetical protein